MAARIRTLTPADLEAIMTIEAASFPVPWTRSMFADDIGREDRIWLVAEHADRLLGYAGAMAVGEEAHVMNLAVAGAARRRRVRRCRRQRQSSSSGAP